MVRHDEHEARGAGAEVRHVAHVRGLTDLFERRPDLAGVHPPADLAAESLRWGA